MVVTEQVQQPVGEQKSHFLDDRAIALRGLAGRRGHRDHDVAEQPRVPRGSRSLPHWKGEDIGRFVLPSVSTIEVANGRVVAEQDRKLGVFEPERGEHRLGAPGQIAGTNRATSQSTGADPDWHRLASGLQLGLGQAAGCQARAGCYARSMFEKVLILRRGEAATRVARTCRRMGIESIVLAAKNAPSSRHIEAADRTIEVAFDETDVIPAEQLLAILEQAGADAAHLGYQGQPEMFELASAAEKAGLAVVGTDLDVLGALADPTTLRAAAQRAHLRTVHDAEGLRRPREVGVLVAADARGEAVAVAECDRSLSVSGHALVHETPSPALIFHADGEAFRMALFESARRLTAELRYAGLLEIRFHLDPGGLSWVSDVKIGLPRNHTLIEMVTGIDLVALQLRISAGETLPEELQTIEPDGHALDTSLLALDRQSEVVSSYSVAPAPQGRARATSSATVGLPLPVDDRPLIAKLTTHAPIRHRAVLSMDRMLAEMHVEPFRTNVAEVRQILSDYAFRAGQYDIESARRFGLR